MKLKMSKVEWQAKLAEVLPLYEAGTYTASEFFWFALPLFDGGVNDKDFWEVLPQDVKDYFVAQLGRVVEANDSVGLALLERLSAVRRVAML
ncbi:hypothetical protein GCM10007907_12600 [Chitinimonas prasina]|uniref:Uncharacterized protein n=1 Tax=Chitinimonas prasina TaxID=1434937 RepID=A0ABQ5YBZ3_9NEIS|nr:hypothetical protein [Chitinimonas prasina]GLR12470.1 hypothetical protein GCM10007907_12600 [Chitinimonas prasina]